RLETLASSSTTTSTPGRRSYFGFDGARGRRVDWSFTCGVFKVNRGPRVPEKPWVPDTNLPGISPPVVKEKRKKKKVPEILGPRGKQKSSKPVKEPGVQSAQEQKPEISQDSKEQVTKTPSLPQQPSPEQKLDLQPEPTVNFLFTLLNTEEPPEPKDSERYWEIQEHQLLGKDDWGPQRTVKEFRDLRDDCVRLQKLLSINLADNLALGLKLQDLSSSFYKCLKDKVKAVQEQVKVVQEEVRTVQEEVKVIQEEVKLFQEEMSAVGEEVEVDQEDSKAFEEEKKVIQEEVRGVQEEVRGVQEEVRGVQEEVRGVQEEVRDVQEEVRGAQEEVRGVQEEVRGVQEEVRDVQEEVRGAQEEVRDVQEKVRGAQKEVRGVQKEVRGVQEEVRGVQEEVRDVQEEVRGVKEEVRDVQEKVRGAQKEVRGVQKEVRGVQEEVR
ncbi:uncharacterized protein PF3D7_1120000-like, partial [Talpa occidentalis]|uniref:uncharacterized protein PF3D7_1120000-like n=1 Tax=Talpa occidentalis TaxID=50954 RepID=UPI0023F77881